MSEITVKATLEYIDNVTAFVNSELEAADCSMKSQLQIDVAIDELFSNICYYAYGDGEGSATVSVEIDGGMAVIRFIDSGVPYDPLKREDPDTTLSAEERKIGGLGIYMVKKSMDKLEYEYRDGKNILTLHKKI